MAKITDRPQINTKTLLKEIITKNLLKQSKLHLVLDIDQTLLHAVCFNDLQPEDFDFLKQNCEDFRESLCMFELESVHYLVKLRPYVRAFLEQANSLFELSLYTKGTKMYARCIAKLLDPEGKYFGQYRRIIGREDTPTEFKTLDLVRVEERAILIIDDTEIWPYDSENLLVIERYNYFGTKREGDGYLKRRSDECEFGGSLMNILEIAKGVHKRFFQLGNNNVVDEDDRRDVRIILGRQAEEKRRMISMIEVEVDREAPRKTKKD
ncbi:RNA polymerase II C-terminal domain phosphatase-like 4 [Rutidosis leptorrhynchoides]|uniref:RNA polymerase II C-terminal domain phosphatase-like 4 n=1 Tax=Rutidosis leptorrhynchoides TaxID=125765 RepID=UPI003A9A0124